MNTEFHKPVFDHTTNTWYVEEIDLHTGRRVACYDFYDEADARQFFFENDTLWEMVNGY